MKHGFMLRLIVVALVILGAALFVADVLNPWTPDPIVGLRGFKYGKRLLASIQSLVGAFLPAISLINPSVGFLRLQENDFAASFQHRISTTDLTCIRRR